MKKERITDRAGKVIGYRDTFGPGSFKQFLRDRAGILVGVYDTKNNLTRDRAGRYIGKGDLTIGLLRK